MAQKSRHSVWLPAIVASSILLLVVMTGCERGPDPGTVPEEVERALRMARGLASQGSFDQALAELDKVALAHPDLAAIYGARARVHRSAGDLQKAADDFATQVRLEPEVAPLADQIREGTAKRTFLLGDTGDQLQILRLP